MHSLSPGSFIARTATQIGQIRIGVSNVEPTRFFVRVTASAGWGRELSLAMLLGSGVAVNFLFSPTTGGQRKWEINIGDYCTTRWRAWWGLDNGGCLRECTGPNECWGVDNCGVQMESLEELGHPGVRIAMETRCNCTCMLHPCWLRISDQSGGGSVVPTGSSTLIPDRPGEDSAALARLALDFATVNGDTSPGSTQYLRGSRNSFAEKLGLLLFAIDREVYIVWIQGNFRPALTESVAPWLHLVCGSSLEFRTLSQLRRGRPSVTTTSTSSATGRLYDPGAHVGNGDLVWPRFSMGLMALRHEAWTGVRDTIL